MKELSAPSACPGFNALRHSRRHALKVGGLGLLGLSMPKLLQAAALQSPKSPIQNPQSKILNPKSRAKSVIFLFQYGGPSHVDMFDMKPNAPEGIRGPYKPISSKADGIQVCERLPKTAKVMDKVTLIRSMTHTMKNHNSAGYYALTGHAPPSDDQRLRDSFDLFPGFGSVVDKLAPLQGAEMPTYVSYPYVIRDGSITPGQHASFLGKEHDPFFFTQDPNAPDFALPELSLPSNLSYERLESRRELQKIVDAQSRLLDYSAAAKGLDSYYDKALGMLN